MSRGKNAIEYLPRYMARLREIRELYEGIQPELDGMYALKDKAMDECFVLTCEGFGLERLEKMLGITSLFDDTVEDRRLRVLAMLNGDTPYTFNAVYQRLKLLCGEGNVSMEYAKDIYTLRVMLGLRAKNQYKAVLEMLKRLLPCNISLKCSLAYNRHSTLKPFKHSDLSRYTQAQLIENVIE